MDRATTNGGFPLPPADEPVRELTSHHDACDGQTRVRLPRAVPSRAVRRVVCDRCAEPYEPARVAEVAAAPAQRRRWLGLPVAAVAVIGILSLLQGGGDDPAPSASLAPTIDTPTEVPGNARLVRESTFQVALPPGWERVTPTGGATFAAVAPGGEADAMLWIERDPKLSFAEFEARSLDQLRSLAGSAGAIRRNSGPTPAQTTAVLGPTSAPDDAPNYEVLISGGPRNHWYYLATTSQPGANAEALEGIELIQGSFLPQGARR